MAWHKGLLQTGRKPNYNQKVAQTFNWYRRCMMGLLGQVQFNSAYFIRSDEGFQKMSPARKAKLLEIEAMKSRTQADLKLLIEKIEEFQKLPLTIEDAEKGKLPYRPKRKCPLCEQMTKTPCKTISDMETCQTMPEELKRMYQS